MSDTTTERDWVSEIGAPAYAHIAEMVAALECDYDRLEELRGELKEAFVGGAEQNDRADEEAFAAWVSGMADSPTGTFREAATELKELELAADDCEDEEEAREQILEDALSVEVRSGWCASKDDMEAEEFRILMTAGGPAVRVVGELSGDGPYRTRLEVQDWGKPWTEYHPADRNTLLTYARVFFFE